MEKKYILSDNVDILEDLEFVSLQLFIETTNKVKIQYITFKFCNHNLQTICKKHLISYHQVDTAILWFINTKGYH